MHASPSGNSAGLFNPWAMPAPPLFVLEVYRASQFPQDVLRQRLQVQILLVQKFQYFIEQSDCVTYRILS